MVVAPPRQLPMQHMARAITGPGPDPPLLGPDEMQLYSYYRPGLSAGTYEVSVVQDIKAELPPQSNGDVRFQTLKVTNVRPGPKPNTGVEEPQKFEVVVPRFTLNPDLINSYYPPDGHQDEGRILPHIVLNDPHYPWEIDAGSTDNMSGPIDGKDGKRNMVPWIGLVVFDPDELRLSEADIKALRIPDINDVSQQNANGTFTMAVKDYFNDTKFIPKGCRIDIEKGYGTNKELCDRIKNTTDLAKVIFPTKKLFTDMFSDCESMKYLAHVRNINTVGFPDAGIEQLGLYSVVVSSRTGRFDITKPTTQVVHLVSIENFDSTVPDIKAWLGKPVDQRQGSDRIGIFSLYSWVYTALPPDPVNFVDTVKNLVKKQQMLRADQPTLDAIKKGMEKMAQDSSKKKASQVLYDRLSAGYTFARWRCETGEETSALNRGPLVPIRQPDVPAADLPDSSNTSKEFQILDKDTGLMDLSYSTAWQLGKTLAISDNVFSAAMLRFRSTLHNSAGSNTRAIMNKMKPKNVLLKSLSVSLQRANDLSCGTPGHPERLRCKCPADPVSDVTDEDAKPVFKREIAAGVLSHSLAGSSPFTGLNKEPANDDDWVTIHNWMADKLFLADIPPHYLIPEASFVPPEALRFFYIDDFWLDCLLDGALSVANHLDRDDDILRKQVKERFNAYLQTPVPKTGIKPQIPSYGFIIRSKIIKTTPDLRITVKWTVPDPPGKIRHPVCRYTRFDETTLICLLDRQPEELDYIELSQPAHQQRFSLGFNLTGPHKANDGKTQLPGRLGFNIRKLYTKDAPITGEWRMSDKQPHEATDEKDGDNPDPTIGDQTRPWYNWDTRCIQLRKMMTDLTSLLQRKPEVKDGKVVDGEYDDEVPNSCALGIELNDPSYYFTIRPPPMKDNGKMVPKPTDGSEVKPPDKVIVPRNRKLYIMNKPAPAPPKPLLMRMAKRTILPPPTILAAATTPSPIPIPPNIPPPGHAPHIQTKTTPFPSSAMALRTKSTPKPSLAGPSLTTTAGTTTAGTSTSSTIPFTQLTSQFTLTLYADYKPFPKSPTRTRDGFDPQSYLPTKNTYLYDLIFSLRKNTTNQTSSYPLLEIQIDIPTEPVPPSLNKPLKPGEKDPLTDPSKEPLIKSNYSGAGPKMLSNQRFIPLLYTDPDSGFLRIRVLPRTASDSYRFTINDAKSEELSFRLAEPEISKVKNGQHVSFIGGKGKLEWRGISTIRMVEIYAVGEDKGTGPGVGVGGSSGVAGGKQTTWPVMSSIEVVKWDVRDVEDERMEREEDEEVGRFKT